LTHCLAVKLFKQENKAVDLRYYKQLKQLINMIYSAMKEDYRKSTFESTAELKNKRGRSSNAFDLKRAFTALNICSPAIRCKSPGKKPGRLSTAIGMRG
jgi:hypothetical protein